MKKVELLEVREVLINALKSAKQGGYLKDNALPYVCGYLGKSDPEVAELIRQLFE